MSPWPRAQIRYLARLGTGHTPSRSVDEYWHDCDIPWLTLADVGQLRDGTLDVVIETKEKISKLGVANSSAVIHSAGTVAMSRTASVGYSCILGTDMATSQDYVTWTCGPGLHPRFLLWVLRGERKTIIGRMQGSTHKTIYMPDIAQMSTPAPPIAQQRAIAEYLDTEIARIDALIAKKRRLVELLEERVVTDAIETILGRKQDIDLAPTGIDWIGDVPRGWEITRLTRVARLESGHTPSRTRKELWANADKNWITLNDVGALKNSEFISETMNLISDAGLAASSARMLPAQTVVLSRDATIGRTGIMTKPMATSQHFAAWVCGNRIDPRYLWAVLTYPMQTYLARFDDGATLRTIGMPHIRKFVSPIPPMDTQRSIVRELEELRAAHNSLAASLEGQVGLLAEKRQALITAAVTGEVSILVAA